MDIFDLELYSKMHMVALGINDYEKCSFWNLLFRTTKWMRTTHSIIRTGKSTGENVKEILRVKQKDTDFQKLVKKRIEETRKKLNLSNQ